MKRYLPAILLLAALSAFTPRAEARSRHYDYDRSHYDVRYYTHPSYFPTYRDAYYNEGSCDYHPVRHSYYSPVYDYDYYRPAIRIHRHQPRFFLSFGF